MDKTLAQSARPVFPIDSDGAILGAERPVAVALSEPIAARLYGSDAAGNWRPVLVDVNGRFLVVDQAEGFGLALPLAAEPERVPEPVDLEPAKPDLWLWAWRAALLLAVVAHLVATIWG